MSKIKSHVCEWVEQGHITQAQANTLYCHMTERPSAISWQRLIASLLLWFGALSFVSGVIFFFAYNWQSLGRFSKFSLIEVAILLTIAVFSWLYYRAALQHDAVTCRNTNRFKPMLFGATPANAVLLAASVLVGALLALVGQTYQTGADPWQLFALWALLILPFAWVAGFDGLWLLVVGLFNLSLGLFFDTFSFFWGDIWDGKIQLLMFVLANVGWYYTFVFLGRKATGRWHAPLLEYACSIWAMGCFTWLISWIIVDHYPSSDAFNIGVICAYFVHLILGFFVFRYWLPRVYPLALGGFSLIAVGTALLIKFILEDRDPIGSFLFIALYIILASTGLSLWLKQVSRILQPRQSPELTLNQGREGKAHE